MSNTLQNWLQTATDNLAPRAVTQISHEITAHVRSAAAQHQLEGMAENAALELAVKELGSAKAAARGYRRAHLTAIEFQMLGRGNPKQIVRRVVLFLLFAGSLAFQFKFSLIPSSISSSFLSGAAIATAISLIAECFERLEQRALCELLSVVVMFNWFLILIFHNIFFDQLFATSGYVAAAVFVIFFLLTLAFGVLRQWNVWRKTVYITSSESKV